jgi:hypothetical protein
MLFGDGDGKFGVFAGDRFDNLKDAVRSALGVATVSDDDIREAKERVSKIEGALERADADWLIDDTQRLRRATKRLAADSEQAKDILLAFRRLMRRR